MLTSSKLCIMRIHLWPLDFFVSFDVNLKTRYCFNVDDNNKKWKTISGLLRRGESTGDSRHKGLVIRKAMPSPDVIISLSSYIGVWLLVVHSLLWNGNYTGIRENTTALKPLPSSDKQDTIFNLKQHISVYNTACCCSHLSMSCSTKSIYMCVISRVWILV